MSRRLRMNVRGLPVDVVYNDRGGGDVVWYLASINWRLLANDRPLALTRREILAIDARCLADLQKRRQDWRHQLSTRREATHGG